MDFAFLPTTLDPPAQETFRVPILPDTYVSPSTASKVEEVAAVMKPEVSAMSADAVYLPMSDLSDGHSLNVDFHAMADRVAANVRSMKVPIEEQAGLMKRIFGDMVDDVLGLKKAGA